MNLVPFRNGASRVSQGQKCLLYGSQLVDLGLCLCLERGRCQNPDTAVAESNGSRTTAERDDTEPTKWPWKWNEVSESTPYPELTRMDPADRGGQLRLTWRRSKRLL